MWVPSRPGASPINISEALSGPHPKTLDPCFIRACEHKVHALASSRSVSNFSPSPPPNDNLSPPSRTTRNLPRRTAFRIRRFSGNSGGTKMVRMGPAPYPKRDIRRRTRPTPTAAPTTEPAMV